MTYVTLDAPAGRALPSNKRDSGVKGGMLKRGGTGPSTTVSRRTMAASDIVTWILAITALA